MLGGGTFAVRARHAGTGGDEPLVMPMSTEQSVIGGRETFGAPPLGCGVELAERTSVQTGEIVTHVPCEWIAPFVHQRHDDLSPVGTD